MAETALFDPHHFYLPPGVVHACIGSEAPFLRSISKQWERFSKIKGYRAAAEFDAEYDRARVLVSRLWNVDADDIGFPSNVAEGVSIVAESIDWLAGDNLCVDINEYPSVVGPFASNPKVALRLGQDNDLGRMHELVDERTRVIAVSYVSYLTGQRVDLAALRALADSVGAMLIVDYTRAAGCLPIDPSIADFAFSGTYKWMLGVSGVAVAYWNRRQHPEWRPRSIGGRSIVDRAVQPDYTKPLPQRQDAVRFTRGTPAHPSVFALSAAAEYLLGFDMREIEAHIAGLSEAFIDRMRDHDIPITTPVAPAERGATICIETGSARAIVDELTHRGVLASHVRGRLRFGFHGYNDLSDVDRAASELHQIWRSLAR